MSNDKFIQISHSFFKQEENITSFYEIGTEGFAIYCYLLLMQGNSSVAQISIKMIRDFLNRDVTKKKKTIEGLSDKRTILKYLIALQRVGLIEGLDKVIDKNIHLNDTLLIRVVKDTTNGWSGISENLFIENIHKLGHIGWSLYCLLFKLHNMSFGGQAGNYGFANPSEKYMGEVLNRHENTIKAYLPLLEKYHLVKIIPQEVQAYVNPNGETEYKYMPNHYIVKAKAYPDDKYFIKFCK